jgi:hypothetical protein
VDQWVRLLVERSIGNMPRIIETTASGSPIPYYATQSTRNITVNPVRRTQLQSLPSGIRYAYSGSFGAGAEAAVSVTLLDIGDSGDHALLCKLQFSVDYDSITAENQFTGFDLAINGVTVMFTKGIWNHAGHASLAVSPEEYEFVLPAHSSLVVLGLSETTNASRCASIIGRPI